jgi:hypothetical protein
MPDLSTVMADLNPRPPKGPAPSTSATALLRTVHSADMNLIAKTIKKKADLPFRGRS